MRKHHQIHTLGAPHYNVHFRFLRKLKDFNALMSGLIQAVPKKTAGLHVVLHGNISAPVRVTDLVEVSKDTASLVVCTRKKNFWLGSAGFL